jgi:hypothetical protein
MRASGKKSKYRSNGHTRRGPTISEQMAAMGGTTTTEENTSPSGVPHDPNYNPVRERKEKARAEARPAWEAENARQKAVNAELIAAGQDPIYPGAENAEYEEEECRPIETATFADLRSFIGGLRWFVPEWVAYALLTGILGYPKVGKSLLVLWALVRPILLGGSRPWFNGQFGVGPEKPGHVLWVDTERSAAINLSRVDAWRLPHDMLKLPFEDKFQVLDLDKDADIKRAGQLVEDYEIPLIVLDSFRGAHKQNENDSRLAHTLQAMGEICERTGCAGIPLHHPAKGLEDTEPSLDWARGSGAWLANIRSQIIIDIPDPIVDGKRDYNRAWRRVQVIGENLGIAPKPFGFRIRPGPLTDESIEFGPAPERPPEEKDGKGRESRQYVAEDFLNRFMLAGQWYDSKELELITSRFGINENDLKRAKKALGIVGPKYARMKKGGKSWECCKPLAADGKPVC